MEHTTKEGKVVICKNPNGRQVNEAFNLLADTKSGDEKSLIGLMDYLDDMAAKGTGLGLDGLNELDTDDKNAIISFYYQKVEGRVDFLKPSPKPQS